MFTGIVEETGVVQAIKKKENLYRLTVKANKVSKGLKIGDSVAIDGACMTIVKQKGKELSFDVMKESLDATTLKNLEKGSLVNLERAMKANARVGGHFVTGHVDTTVKIKAIKTLPNYVEYQFNLPKALQPYFVPKGSVTIDGMSLTIGKVTQTYFSVYLIPHTLEITNIGHKDIGDEVNIETDLLAKYILKNFQK